MAENKLADMSTEFAVKILNLTDGKYYFGRYCEEHLARLRIYPQNVDCLYQYGEINKSVSSFLGFRFYKIS